MIPEINEVIYDTCSSNNNCNYSSNKPSHIRIPDDVTQIESEAFQDNEDLISIEITEGVETIGEKAFKGCSNLESIPGTYSVIVLEQLKTMLLKTAQVLLRYYYSK